MWGSMFGAACSSQDNLPDVQAELDRFCNALISIREEIAEIEKGSADRCAPAPAAACRCLSMRCQE